MIQNRIAPGLVVMGLLLLLEATALGQQGNSAKGSKPKSPDKSFLMAVAPIGLKEVALGRLAVQKATRRYVKVYGQRMVDDYTVVNNQIKELAAAFGVILPTEMNAKQKADFRRLEKLSDLAFDQEYIRIAGINDHLSAKILFQSEIQGGQDYGVKSFASETLPYILSYLGVAKDISLQFEEPPGKKK